MTKQRRGLFGEGARLPEELSRLLFLEPVLEGRRVLEVGARSDAVARFLIELGAARVVCASEDRDLVETLRAENDLDKVDFRAIRPGVLPGDDGAFDLVIDFGLPEALAAGFTFRLTDMGRLLSQDGFAITALKSADARGLGTLLGGASVPVVVGANAAAGLARGASTSSSSDAPTVTYRGLVEALKLQFDLVQVYFQSLLLGYLFGSFDAEPKDDGISPHTALMGDTPEPAGHYLFAFGRAVPVIEDVALVQVPFSDLLDVVSRAGRSATHLPAAAAAATALPADARTDARTDEGRSGPGARRADQSELRVRSTDVVRPPARDDAVPTDEGAPVDDRVHVETLPTGEAPAAPAIDQATVDALAAAAAARELELHEVRIELADREQAMVQIASRIERLKSDIDVLVAELERRTAERDELAVFLEGSDSAIAARDALIASLRSELEGGIDRTRELEETARAGSSLAESAKMLVVEHEALKGQRNDLIERIALLEGERVTHENRVRVLEEAHELSILRVGELEDALLTLESQRGQLAAELARVEGERNEDALRMERERGAERQLLEAALQTHQAQVGALESELADVRARLLAANRENAERDAHGQTAAERAEELARRARELEQQVEAQSEETRRESARAKREAQDRLFLEERTKALEVQLEQSSSLAGDVDGLTRRTQALEHELARAKEEAAARRLELEEDARRLAEGVKTLVHEREENRARADAEHARAEENQARAEEQRVRAEEQRARADAGEERVGTLVVSFDEKQRELHETRARLEETTQTTSKRIATLEEEGEATTRKLRAAHAALEEARRELGGAREGFQEIAGQRDTLNQVVSSRERELFATKDELLQATAEVNRLKEQLDAQQKALAEARQRVSTVELDRATQKRREEELGRAHQEATAAVVETNERVARLQRELDDVRAELERTQQASAAEIDAVRADAERTRSAALDAAAEQARREIEGVRGERDAGLEQARRETAEAQRALEAARAEASSAHEVIAGLRSELGTTAESLEAQLVTLRAEVAEASQRAAGFERDLGTARDEEERLRAEGNRAHDDVVRLEAENARIAGELGSLSEEANRTLAAADDDRASFMRDLEGAQAELARVRSELSAAAQDLEAASLTERGLRLELEQQIEDSTRALDDSRSAFDAERAAIQEALAAEMQAHEADQRSVADVTGAAAARIGVLEGALEEAQFGLDRERAASELLRASLGEARTLLERERADSELLRASLGEARSLLDVERARGDLFGEELEEAHVTLTQERARGDLFASTLAEAHTSLARERTRGDLFAQQLDEASRSLGRERARGDLFAFQLDEAQLSLDRERARGDLFAADLDEAQGHIWALRAKTRVIVDELNARAVLSETVLTELRTRLDQEKARGDLLSAELNEAQAASTAAVTYATLLAGELDDARETFRRRKGQYEATVETERIRAAAAINDSTRVQERVEQLTRAIADQAASAEGRLADERMQLEHEADRRLGEAVTEAVSEARAAADVLVEAASGRAASAEDALRRTENDLRKALHDAEDRMRATGQAITGLELELKDLKERLGQQQSDDMLLQAEHDRLRAMAESAERERDSLLGDLGSHQTRANHEAQRRLAVEDELAKLRLTHNQVATEALRLKQEVEAAKRALALPAPLPEGIEQQIAALKERVDTLEKTAVQKDAKIAEQADRINRLTERLVREAGIA